MHEIHIFELWIDMNFQCVILTVTSARHLGSREKGLNRI